MIDSDQNDQRKNRILGVLFPITFAVHTVWIIYVLNDKDLAFVKYLLGFFSRVYVNMGFEWKGDGAYVITAALVSSFFVNSIRRLLEGFFFGWPRFKKHDRHSFVWASTLLLGYGAMTCFAVGFIGEKYSSRPLDVINIVLIATETYIFGLIVDIFDDAISGIYRVYRGGKA